jgi:hypothetical protein
MAKRHSRRLDSDVNTAETVDMLNREVPPGNNPSKKRKIGNANENSPAGKRRAIARPTEDIQARRKSTRLARPTSFKELRRSGNAGRRQDRHGFDGPTTPPPSVKITKAVNRQGGAKSTLDGNNNAFVAEEGEEDATNPLMRSPAKSTRSYDKEIRQGGKAGDGESIIVGAQPVQAPQRKQRLLKPRAQVTNSALSKPISESAKSRPTLLRPPNRATAAEEEVELGAGASEHESSIEGDQTLSGNTSQEQQDRTAAAEELLSSVEDQLMDDQPEEVTRRSSTKGAFARASGLYECKKSWDSMLEAVRDNLDEEDQDNQVAEIRDLAGLIDAAKLAYSAIRHADGSIMEDEEDEIEELLDDIGERVRTMRPTNDRKRNSRLIRDVYVQGIPKMVHLLKYALVTRSLKEEPSIASLKELVKIIDATLDLCVKAYNWRPRPVLEYGVKRRTRNVIKMSLEALRAAYIAAQHDYPDDEEEEAHKVEKRQALAEHVAKFLAHELEKKQRAEHNRRERNHDRNRRHTNGALLQATDFDVDQLDLDDVVPAPALNGLKRSRLPWTETGVVAARRSLASNIPVRPLARHVPQVSRERTEDIPGPMARRWSEEEDSALLRGLEEFTDANRYLEIDEAYGSANGPLKGRDVDELMQRARFYKQSMASHIEAEREKVGNVDRWAYLLSVEG